MFALRDMLVRNGLICSTDEDEFRMYGSLLSNSLVVLDRDGRTRYKVEKAANGVDLILVDWNTRAVVGRMPARTLF